MTDVDGVPIWARFIDGQESDITYGLDVLNDGSVIACGQLGFTTTIVTLQGGALGGDIRNGSFTKANSVGGGFLYKYTASGEWVWLRGPTRINFVEVTHDNDDNIFALGHAGAGVSTYNMLENAQDGDLTAFTAARNPSTGDDTILVKLNSSGKILWTRMIAGTAGDFGENIGCDAAGNVYIVVQGDSASLSLTDNATGGIAGPTFNINRPSTGASAFLVKYNSEGTPQWARWFDGTGEDRHFGMNVTPTGDVYVTGFITSATINLASNAVGGDTTFTFTATKPSTGRATYVVKYNNNGVPQWLRWIDGNADDTGLHVTTDYLGNVIFTGEVNSTSINLGSNAIGGIIPTTTITKGAGLGSGALIIKYTSEGDFIWSRWIDGAGNDGALGVDTDDIGNIYVGGLIGATSTSINLASNAFGGNTSYTFTMTKSNSIGFGAFLVKYSPTGVPIWSRVFDGPNLEWGLNVSVGPTIGKTGAIYFSGRCDGGTGTTFNIANNAIGGITTYTFTLTKPSNNNGGFLIKF